MILHWSLLFNAIALNDNTMYYIFIVSSKTRPIYHDFYPKLIRVLPLSDAIFVAQLVKNGFLPGDTKESIKAKPTPAEKTTFFLDNCIAPGFNDDGSNPLFNQLLELMERSDNMVLKSVAKEIKSKLN